MPKKYKYTKKTGRPTKKLEDCLPENWKDIVLLLSADGASDCEIRSAFCVQRDKKGHAIKFNSQLWSRLEERENEFRQTLQKGEVLCKAWWMERGRKNVGNSFFNSSVFFMNMKNRFGWRDRTEIDHNLGNNFLEKFKDLDTKGLIEKINVTLGKTK